VNIIRIHGWDSSRLPVGVQSQFYFSALNSYYASMTNDTRQYIDLHVHSNCSDGAFSPSMLVDLAQQEGLNAFAISDHDSIAGLAEGIEAAKRSDIELIPAVELSVQYEAWQDVHLLGYGLDYTDKDFLWRLNCFREQRVHRNEAILARVNERLKDENLLTIGLDEVLLHARDVIGRPHIARALLARGYVKTVEDAFRRYLISCNIPKHYWPINDALAEIRRLGGVAVLAHPTSITTNREDLRRIINDLSRQGLDGIEVFNNLAQGGEMEFLRRRAKESGLLITGGSDFHGIEQGLQMGRGRGGVRFSDTLLAPLKNLLFERQRT